MRRKGGRGGVGEGDMERKERMGEKREGGMGEREKDG